jgi:hypothetical protein
MAASVLDSAYPRKAQAPHVVKELPMTTPTPASDLPWYRRLLVGIEIGPTGANDVDEIYMARATGAEWVRNLLAARAEYGVVFMKDQNFAYYNSIAARKAPNLKERDLLAECIAEAQRAHLPIIAYCQVQYDTATWDGHPEWRMKDGAGKEIGGRLCYNSGYLERIKQLAAEMMAYPIAGFHFDMLDYGFGPPVGCWCEHCRAAFWKEYGTEIPAGVTWDEGWDRMLQFRCDSNTRFCRQLQEYVHSRRPELSVDFNYHGYPPFAWYPGEKPAQHALNGDFVTAEGLPSIFGHNNPSLLALFMAGARPGGPIQGVTSRSVYNHHDYTVRPAAEMKWEVLTYLAHGAQCTIVDKANYDGTLDSIAYQRIGEAFGEAREKRDTFGHRPVREVGLYFSARSRDWYAREDATRYTAAFVGAHRALINAHIQVGVVCDENVPLQWLREFPVVYLAGVPILDPREMELLTSYVTEGGKLLVTGLTGACYRFGRPQEHSSIEALIGARLTRLLTEHSDQYLRLPAGLAKGDGAFLGHDIPEDWPLFTWGPAAVYEPAGAAAYGDLMVAYRSKQGVAHAWMNLMSPDRAVGPGLLVNRVGKGTVVTIPLAIDAAYAGDYRMPEHRRLIRNVVRHLHPEPLVEIDAPVNVESVVTEDPSGGRLYAHLLAFNGAPTFSAAAFAEGRRVLPPVMEEPMRYQATLRMRDRIEDARATGAGTRIDRKQGVIQLTTDEIHTVVTISR